MSKLGQDRAKKLTRSTSIEAGIWLLPARRYDTFGVVSVLSSGPLMPDPSLPPGVGLLSAGIIIETGHEKSRLG